jgi:hypothetical protein
MLGFSDAAFFGDAVDLVFVSGGWPFLLRRVAQPFPKVLKWVSHPSRFWRMGRVGFFGRAFDFVCCIFRKRSRSSASSNNVRPKPTNPIKRESESMAEKPHPR